MSHRLLSRRRALGLMVLGSASVLPAADPPARSRFLSYNIHHGAGLDGKLDLPRIAAVLRQTKAGMIALQEVDDATARTGKVKQAEELARLLGKRAFFAKAMDHAGGGYGNAILYPDDGTAWETRRIALDGGGGEPRVAAMVSVPAGGTKRFWFVSLHLDHRDREARARQLQMLLDAIPPEDAVLLAGDFNADRTEIERILTVPWRHFPKSPPATTFPADKPETEIDHMFWRGNASITLKSVDHHVVSESVASDHRPILLEASWSDP